MDRSTRERDAVARVAREYRNRGYEVIIEPRTGMPSGLQQFVPDILAIGNGEHVIIEIKSRESLGRSTKQLIQISETINSLPGWRIELVAVRDDPRDDINQSSIVLGSVLSNRFEHARALLESNDPAGAVALVWPLAEAAFRGWLVTSYDVRATHPRIIKSLFSYGLVNESDLLFLERMARERNAAVHGFPVGDVSTEDLARLRRLIEAATEASGQS